MKLLRERRAKKKGLSICGFSLSLSRASLCADCKKSQPTEIDCKSFFSLSEVFGVRIDPRQSSFCASKTKSRKFKF